MCEIGKTKTLKKLDSPLPPYATKSCGLENDQSETRALFDAMMKDYPKTFRSFYFDDDHADPAAVLFGGGAFAATKETIHIYKGDGITMNYPDIHNPMSPQ